MVLRLHSFPRKILSPLRHNLLSHRTLNRHLYQYERSILGLKRACRQQQPRLGCTYFSSLTATTSTRDDQDETDLQSVYQSLVDKGEIHQDEHQIQAMHELNRLYRELQTCPPPKPLPPPPPLQSPPLSSTSWFNLFERAVSPLASSISTTTSFAPTIKTPKGVYLHGGVGCGKTFLMHLFYDSVDATIVDKQKVHFHKFMLGVHQQMHEAKMIEGIQGDVLPRVIARTLERGRLLCFDEFQVTDVADALILRRLFTGLLEQGAVIVATSNRPPQDLYLNGLQRDRFLPFIQLLEERLAVVSMWESETDYRIVQGAHKAKGVYFVGNKAKKEFDELFYAITKQGPVVATSLTTQGRRVRVPMASLKAGVARFTFEDLCTKALGAADYLVIGQHFHTVFVENVPALTQNELNWVRRFIVFVDSMYESHVKLILHAATPPEGIFQVDLHNQVCDEVFAFDRTRSRLEEMGSSTYLQKRWAGSSNATTTANTMIGKVELRVEPSLSNHAM